MIELWTILIAAATAVACALSGVFLVLKREALVSEGLAHAVLPGIVLAFVLTRDRSSPLLIVSAALAGLLMVLLVQAVRRTGIVDGDASLGVVFPALFSIGVLLANAELAQTNFDAHCVIDGNLALSPLDRLVIGGTDVGPRPFWSIAAVLALVLGFVVAFFKELKLMTFDALLASSLGFRPRTLHLVWLTLVSMVTVTAFETAGSVLVVALMIAPPAAAQMWTDDLRRMLWIASAIGVASALVGYELAFELDVAPNGPIAASAGGLFLVSFVLAPRRGLVARSRVLRSARSSTEIDLVVAQLDRAAPSEFVALASALGWGTRRLKATLGRAVQAGRVRVEEADGPHGARLVHALGAGPGLGEGRGG